MRVDRDKVREVAGARFCEVFHTLTFGLLSGVIVATGGIIAEEQFILKQCFDYPVWKIL